MHIRPAEPGQPDGQKREPGTVMKGRLGGSASRVPVQTSKKTAETPLRALVSAIGQSLGSRTPLRGHTAGTRTPSSVKSSLFSAGGKGSSSTPAENTRSKSLFSSESRNNGTASAAAATAATARSTTAASNSSRVPSTPKSSRTQATASTSSTVPATPLSSRVRATAATPSNRRSSLSSSSSGYSSNSASSNSSTIKQSNASSTPSSRHVPATPSSRQVPATPSTASRKLDTASTPVTKKSSMPPRTPKTQNNPNTPSSKPSCIPLPTPRRSTVNSTPGPKQASTPQARSKSFFPTTPVSKKHTSEHPPTTPISGVESNNGFSTPYGQNSSNQTFYTPTSTLPLTPLQHRNFNVPESSRKLHFGINVAAMVEQENLGKTTPRPASTVITEATFSFDKNRLAQIKARKNTSQLLKSPAQRIRAPDFLPTQTPSKTPSRVLQQVAEDHCSHFDDGAVVTSENHSPARRRVANSLF